MQHNLKAMKMKWDLKMKQKNTKAMRTEKTKGDCEVKIGDYQLEQVDTMKHLVAIIMQ